MENLNYHKLYTKAVDWVLLHGPKIVLGIVVLIIGQWVIKVIGRWLKTFLHRRDFNPSLEPFLQSLINALLQVLLILGVMQIMGIQMTVFAAGVASLGVAIGLALSGTLQNFACGLLILLLKPFKVGDNIIAQGQDGIVSSIQIFYTIVTTFDNKTVIIPNSKLSNEVIVNISRDGRRRLDIEIKFPYTAEFEKIQEAVKKTIALSEKIIKDPAPKIGVSKFEFDGFVMEIKVWVDALTYYEAKNGFQEKLLQDFKANGIR